MRRPFFTPSPTRGWLVKQREKFGRNENALGVSELTESVDCLPFGNASDMWVVEIDCEVHYLGIGREAFAFKSASFDGSLRRIRKHRETLLECDE